MVFVLYIALVFLDQKLTVREIASFVLVTTTTIAILIFNDFVSQSSDVKEKQYDCIGTSTMKYLLIIELFSLRSRVTR